MRRTKSVINENGESWYLLDAEGNTRNVASKKAGIAEMREDDLWVTLRKTTVVTILRHGSVIYVPGAYCAEEYNVGGALIRQWEHPGPDCPYCAMKELE